MDDALSWGWHRDKLGEAIDAICRGALPGHLRHPRAAVNRLVQAGIADFSDKLGRCGIRRTGRQGARPADRHPRPAFNCRQEEVTLNVV
jgi:hypothetical protein